VIDTARKTVTIDGVEIKPTKSTWRLCEYLAANPGWVRTPHQIMDAIGMSYNVYDTGVRSAVKRARKEGIACIKTRWGMGYYWEP